MKRAIALAAALAALMTATGCAVVALCFALYAVLRDVITPAGASAAIVAICAVIAGVAALVAYQNFRPTRLRTAVPPTRATTLTEQVMDVVHERPLVAVGIALAAGAAAFANPALVTAVLRAFTDRTRNRP